jgi:hypothetical protein
VALGQGSFETPRAFPVFADTLGSQFLSHPAIEPYTVTVSPGAESDPLVAGIEPFDANDELYLSEYHGELEPLLETRWSGHDEHPSGSRHHASLRVGHAPRSEHEPAGTRPELPLADLEDVLALQHVEELVLVLVHVQRRVDRLVLLEQRERTGGGLGRGFEQDFDLAEGQALTLLCG